MIRKQRHLHRWTWLLLGPLIVFMVIFFSQPDLDKPGSNSELVPSPKGELP